VWRKAKHLTLSLLGVALAIGLVALIAGVIAVGCSQPWHVYYPLLLGGIITVAVLGGNLFPVLRRYRSDELRTMAAADAWTPGASFATSRVFRRFSPNSVPVVPKDVVLLPLKIGAKNATCSKRVPASNCE
jgi:hypothetical protein